MFHRKNHHHHSRTTLLWLTLLSFYSITMLTIVESESLSMSKKSASSPSASGEESGPLLTFLLRPVDSSSSLVQSNANNNAAIQSTREVHPQHKDNDSDNNDSNVSSESDSGEVGLRLRREATGDRKVIATNWGTYEEQSPVVVNSESRTIDTVAATSVVDEETPTFSDEFQSERDDSSVYGEGSISYEDYEAGRFEGRQFYPSRGGGYDSGEQEEQPDGYYQEKYYATTVKPLNQRQELLRGEQSEQGHGKGPYAIRHPNRGGPQREEEEEPSSGGILGFVQKAKTFYDIFRAMNSAWKTVEEHYRRTGEGIFPQDLKKMNASTRMALLRPNPNQAANNNKQSNTKRPKTTKAPITTNVVEENKQQQKQKVITQEIDENRSRRSSLDAIVNNDEEETASTHLTTTALPLADSSTSAEVLQIPESDLESSDSESDSSSSTAVAEGRYIKGDPLKGYYDFVITEGSYKFWAAFQVGTALLIIYSTFAAIYYSKVNPLVSDYDYIDYLGGGRSLSDDSDFVDTDAPTGGATAADGSKTAATPKGATTSSRKQQQQLSSAGWFGWLPHAGHTLRFILESIDKGYNEE